MNLPRRIVAVLIGVVGLSVLQAAHGANAVRGKALFANTNGSPQSCASAACHSGFPAVKRNDISKGSNPSTILNAISGNDGGMRILAPYVNATDANDIAAYIANPAAGDGAAGIAVSVTSLTFPSQTLGTTSAAQAVTLTNTGTAVLNLTALTFGGAASAEFARSGTCQVGTNVAAGGSCSLQVTFTPAASGARNATLTISHNAAGGTSTLTLLGTGALAPAAASVTPTTLSYTQTINTTSLAQAVTVRNAGGQPLTLAAIGIAGPNAAEFASGASTCTVGTVLSANASCNLQLTFRPTAAGARSATLTIGHNAATSPSTVALTGTGTATAQPAVSLSASTLDFGAASLGTKSTAQAITLTNSGQAPLVLAGLALGGTASGDFALVGTCANGATVAPGGTCTLQLTFAPTAVGARSGTLTVTSNAANGSPVVALSGSGVQYAISVNPAALSMQSPMGVMSAVAQAVITDSGASPLTLTSIAVTGPFSLQQGSNSCGAGPMDLSSGQSCSVYVAFLPAAAGAATGELVISSESLAQHTRIALTARATLDQTVTSETTPPPSSSSPELLTSAAVAPSNMGGGCTVGPADQLFDPILALMLAASLFEVLRRRARAHRR